MSATQKVVTDKVTGDGRPKQNTNSEIISNNDEILALLTKLQSRHSLLTVTIDGIETAYGSTMLEINREQQYLVLDELNPLAGHDTLIPGSILRINTQFAGAMVRFTTAITAIDGDDSAAYYKVPLPDRIEYHQRRNAFRVPVGINDTIPVSLKTEEGVAIAAELRDISVGGMALRVNEVPHVKLREGDIIPTCTIRISNNRQIMAALNICRVQQVKESGMLRIGAQFIKMNSTDIRELEHFVAEMQREMIKKLRRVNQ